LRKHVPLQIKQEKHHQGAPNSAKRAKNEAFENEDFNFNEDPILEDFYAESHNKKVFKCTPQARTKITFDI
jgi:hypothetical protein